MRTLDDDIKNRFDMRTIRIIVVRQMNPEGKDSIYEIFNRLNTGGDKFDPSGD